MKDYKLLVEDNPSHLEKAINNHAKSGWRVHTYQTVVYSVNLLKFTALIEREVKSE